MVGPSARRLFSLLLVCLLLASATTPAIVAADASDESTIHRTLTLSLTPDDPGSIEARATFDIPENVRSLETTLPADATVVDTEGFTEEGERTYRWDGTTADPSIRFTVETNETTTGVRAKPNDDPGAPGGLTAASRAQSGTYSFVDTGPWAIVAVPQFSTGWRYVGDRPEFEKSVEVAGEGATGGEVAFLGPHRTISRTAHDQAFTFVIPAAADLKSEPSAILDSVVAASDTLRVGGRDDEVFMVAAPASVEWGAAGIEYGGSDFWVKANERVTNPRNVWVHEYVHTRQAYATTETTRWTKEAGAEYYAALLSLEQGRITFATFQRHLERGTTTPTASAVLSDPGTWPSGTPYFKGALVYGAIDRQIREASNASSSMQTVLSRMNSDPNEVSAADLYAAVGAAGNPETRHFAERYAGTRHHPDVWTANEHQDAFSALPARVGYDVTALRVTGEHRNETIESGTVLTTGEAVTATVNVTNAGGAPGEYATTLYVADQPVANRTGTAPANTARSVVLTHRFEDPGTYTVTVAGESQRVVVAEPADPQVSELAVDADHHNGTWEATVTVTLSNPESRPSTGTVPVTLNGETIATLTVDLPTNGTYTETVTTTIAPGNHTIRAGDTATSLDVPARTGSENPIPAPGFDPVTAGIAFVLLTAVAASRRP